MWSSGSIDLENVDLVLDHRRMIESVPQFNPIPYTFTKLENGRKKTSDETCMPPCWLLLDHTIAVVWLLFNFDAKLQALSIDDLKWAYEFLKRIKNQRGENPPDVKVCLKEIQDRLINLYARLSSPEQEKFEEIDTSFGGEVLEDSTASYINTSYYTKELESNFDELSLSTKDNMALTQGTSSEDLTTVETENRDELQATPDVFPLLEEDSSDVCEETETGDDDEVEKYVLSLFEHEKKEEAMQAKNTTKSLIPMAKRPTPPVVSSTHDTFKVTKREKKMSKRVHCITQMRSLEFQKSMKVKHNNGEQEAYSKMKTEILTIDPDPSKDGVMNFLKEWRSEQVNRLHKEHKKLSSIEEYMKELNQEVKPHFEVTPPTGLKDSKTTKSTRRLLS